MSKYTHRSTCRLILLTPKTIFPLLFRQYNRKKFRRLHKARLIWWRHQLLLENHQYRAINSLRTTWQQKLFITRGIRTHHWQQVDKTLRLRAVLLLVCIARALIQKLEKQPFLTKTNNQRNHNNSNNHLEPTQCYQATQPKPNLTLQLKTCWPSPALIWSKNMPRPQPPQSTLSNNGTTEELQIIRHVIGSKLPDVTSFHKTRSFLRYAPRATTSLRSLLRSTRWWRTRRCREGLLWWVGGSMRGLGDTWL